MPEPAKSADVFSDKATAIASNVAEARKLLIETLNERGIHPASALANAADPKDSEIHIMVQPDHQLSDEQKSQLRSITSFMGYNVVYQEIGDFYFE